LGSVFSQLDGCGRGTSSPPVDTAGTHAASPPVSAQSEPSRQDETIAEAERARIVAREEAELARLQSMAKVEAARSPQSDLHERQRAAELRARMEALQARLSAARQVSRAASPSAAPPPELPAVAAKVSVDEPAYMDKQVFVRFEWPNPDAPQSVPLKPSEAVIPPFQPTEDMTATLSYSTAMFALASPQEILLHFERDHPTRAQWSLTPLKLGDSTVTVTLWYMRKDSSGNLARQDYKAGEATVHVTVGPEWAQLIFEWLSDHWEFVAGVSAALGVLLAWLRKRSKGAKRRGANDHGAEPPGTHGASPPPSRDPVGNSQDTAASPAPEPPAAVK
jgi:hypothetical protein